MSQSGRLELMATAVTAMSTLDPVLSVTSGSFQVGQKQDRQPIPGDHLSSRNGQSS
jgi:hypothetical protein